MLILIAHGSHDPQWRSSVESLVDSLRTDQVRLAYMQCTPPTLIDVASEAIAAGAKTIRILPLFLTAEGHVARNVRSLVEQARETLAPIELQLLPPMGRHPGFLDLLREIAAEDGDDRNVL